MWYKRLTPDESEQAKDPKYNSKSRPTFFGKRRSLLPPHDSGIQVHFAIY